MRPIVKEHLKKFVKYYYQLHSDTLPSFSTISKELDITITETRTYIKYFELCNYIYNKGHTYELFKTKRNFKQFTNIEDNGTHLIFSNEDYKIVLNKFEMSILDPNFKIETTEDLIYMLFLFTISICVEISQKGYLKNNELWYIKECRSYIDKSLIYMCEFTQHNQEINLVNI